MSYRVGCSGWSYNHWRDSFYPPGLPQSRWFDHYVSLFDTVEINNSFYHTPGEKVFEGWGERAPSGFVYAVKVNRTVSQFYKLGERAYPRFDDFVRRAERMGSALGPLLLQLPPSLGRDDDRLAAFLALPAISQHLVAVEFRHKSWFADEVYGLLRHYGAALVVSDFKDLPVARVATSGWVYARYHGPSGRYFGSYTEEELRAFARGIQDLAPTGYVYFNNDAEAAAPVNALRLREMLGE